MTIVILSIIRLCDFEKSYQINIVKHCHCDVAIKIAVYNLYKHNF